MIGSFWPSPDGECGDAVTVAGGLHSAALRPVSFGPGGEQHGPGRGVQVSGEEIDCGLAAECGERLCGALQARRRSRSGSAGVSTANPTGARSTELTASAVASSRGSSRTPQRCRPNLASVRTASTASCGSPTSVRSTMPIALALLAAIAIVGSMSPGNVTAANSNVMDSRLSPPGEHRMKNE